MVLWLWRWLSNMVLKYLQFSDGRIQAAELPTDFAAGTILNVTHRRTGEIVAARVSPISHKWIPEFEYDRGIDEDYLYMQCGFSMGVPGISADEYHDISVFIKSSADTTFQYRFESIISNPTGGGGKVVFSETVAYSSWTEKTNTFKFTGDTSGGIITFQIYNWFKNWDHDTDFAAIDYITIDGSLITNGSFESDFNNCDVWNLQWIHMFPKIETDDPYSGDKYLRFCPSYIPYPEMRFKT